MKNIIYLTFLLSLTFTIKAQAPQHLIFTYTGDPSTSLCVNWQTLGGSESEATVYYDTKSRAGDPAEYKYKTTGTVHQIPGVDKRFIYQVELPNLQAGTTYYLVAGSASEGISREIKVKTIPDDDSTIRFVTGGDMGTSALARQLLMQSAKFHPDFALVGGDVAYANGKLESIGKWDSWLNYYTEEMITPDGYSIPVVLAIGNHEVRGAYGKTAEEAPLFFGLFAQEGDQAYFSRQFGKNLLFLILDSGHVTAHADQVDWMKAELEAHADVKYKAALYHVPLYPSHRSFGGTYSTLGREHWAPVFDQYGLTVAFENHDHTYKRSHLLKDNAVTEDGQGTLYLGDGCWGRDGRRVDEIPAWYLKQSGSFEHFWFAELGPEKAVYKAVDANGNVFDIYPETEPESADARAVFESKRSTYFLPSDIIEKEDFITNSPEWVSGETTIRITNTLDRPARFSLTLTEKPTEMELTGDFQKMFDLSPGEVLEKTLRLQSKTQQPVSVKDSKIRIMLRAITDPDTEQAKDYEGYKAIQVREE